MKYVIIQQNLPTKSALSIRRASQALGVSKSGYYKWMARCDSGSPVPDGDQELRSQIHKIALEFPRYGYRRITKELHHRGYQVNHKRVHRLMREDNLLCVRKRFKPATTDSNHNLKTYPNRILNLRITGPNQVWASDITYIQLSRKFAYLAVILDLFSRRCIGWELSQQVDTQLTLAALRKALENRWSEELPGLIHHSDQGVQYASKKYVECLEGHGIQVSMSRIGNPYDNAHVESFIKTLKWEEVYLKEYETFPDARANVGRFIEEVYNKKRIHSSLGYQSPVNFEKEVTLSTDA